MIRISSLYFRDSLLGIPQLLFSDNRKISWHWPKELRKWLVRFTSDRAVSVNLRLFLRWTSIRLILQGGGRINSHSGDNCWPKCATILGLNLNKSNIGPVRPFWDIPIGKFDSISNQVQPTASIRSFLRSTSFKPRRLVLGAGVELRTQFNGYSRWKMMFLRRRKQIYSNSNF